MLLGDDDPRRIARLGPRQAAILERVNRRLGGQVEVSRMAPSVPREGPLERQYQENLARHNRDRERNVAERARADIRNEAVVGLGVERPLRRAAARIDELRQMVAAFHGNVEEQTLQMQHGLLPHLMLQRCQILMSFGPHVLISGREDPLLFMQRLSRTRKFCGRQHRKTRRTPSTKRIR